MSDLVRVVRCADCEHAHMPRSLPNCFCTYYHEVRQLTDFCNHGERRKSTEQKAKKEIEVGSDGCPVGVLCPMDGFQYDCPFLWTDKCPSWKPIKDMDISEMPTKDTSTYTVVVT